MKIFAQPNSKVCTSLRIGNSVINAAKSVGVLQGLEPINRYPIGGGGVDSTILWFSACRSHKQHPISLKLCYF